MFDQATEKKAEHLAQLTGKDSGQALVKELLEEKHSEWEKNTLTQIVAEAKASGLSDIPASQMAEWVKSEARRRREAQSPG